MIEVKNRYWNILYAQILLFFLNSCTPDYDLIENLDESSQIPVSFSLVNVEKNQFKAKKQSNDIILSQDTSLIVLSMEEEEWKDRTFLQTKASWTPTGNQVSWTTGDSIGVYMRSAVEGTTYFDRNNVRYNIATGGSSSGNLVATSNPLNFPDRVTDAQFFAYYPYSASAGNSLIINYALPTNQTAPSGISAADLMSSNVPITNGSSPTVGLNFSHRMVLLSFRINATLSLLIPPTLTQVTVSGQNVTNTGTLNLSTGVVTPNTTSTTINVTTSQVVNFGSYAYVDVIINPTIIANNSDMSKLKVTLYFAGLLSHSTSLVTSGTFVGGTRYVYNLSVVLSL